MTKQERAALLKVRYAGRYDSIKPGQSYPKDEAAEEQTATRVDVPRGVYDRLIECGLIKRKPDSPGSLRLTDAGREALKK